MHGIRSSAAGRVRTVGGSAASSWRPLAAVVPPTALAATRRAYASLARGPRVRGLPDAPHAGTGATRVARRWRCGIPVPVGVYIANLQAELAHVSRECATALAQCAQPPARSAADEARVALEAGVRSLLDTSSVSEEAARASRDEAQALLASPANSRAARLQAATRVLTRLQQNVSMLDAFTGAPAPSLAEAAALQQIHTHMVDLLWRAALLVYGDALPSRPRPKRVVPRRRRQIAVASSVPRVPYLQGAMVQKSFMTPEEAAAATLIEDTLHLLLTPYKPVMPDAAAAAAGQPHACMPWAHVLSLDVASYHRLLRVASMTSLPSAFYVYERMVGSGLTPTRITYTLLLHACLRHKAPGRTFPILLACYQTGFMLSDALKAAVLDSFSLYEPSALETQSDALTLALEFTTRHTMGGSLGVPPLPKGMATASPLPPNLPPASMSMATVEFVLGLEAERMYMLHTATLARETQLACGKAVQVITPSATPLGRGASAGAPHGGHAWVTDADGAPPPALPGDADKAADSAAAEPPAFVWSALQDASSQAARAGAAAAAGGPPARRTIHLYGMLEGITDVTQEAAAAGAAAGSNDAARSVMWSDTSDDDDSDASDDEELLSGALGDEGGGEDEEEEEASDSDDEDEHGDDDHDEDDDAEDGDHSSGSGGSSGSSGSSDDEGEDEGEGDDTREASDGTGGDGAQEGSHSAAVAGLAAARSLGLPRRIVGPDNVTFVFELGDGKEGSDLVRALQQRLGVAAFDDAAGSRKRRYRGRRAVHHDVEGGEEALDAQHSARAQPHRRRRLRGASHAQPAFIEAEHRTLHADASRGDEESTHGEQQPLHGALHENPDVVSSVAAVLDGLRGARDVAETHADGEEVELSRDGVAGGRSARKVPSVTAFRAFPMSRHPTLLSHPSVHDWRFLPPVATSATAAFLSERRSRRRAPRDNAHEDVDAAATGHGEQEPGTQLADAAVAHDGGDALTGHATANAPPAGDAPAGGARAAPGQSRRAAPPVALLPWQAQGLAYDAVRAAVLRECAQADKERLEKSVRPHVQHLVRTHAASLGANPDERSVAAETDECMRLAEARMLHNARFSLLLLEDAYPEHGRPRVSGGAMLDEAEEAAPPVWKDVQYMAPATLQRGIADALRCTARTDAYSASVLAAPVSCRTFAADPAFHPSAAAVGAHSSSASSVAAAAAAPRLLPYHIRAALVQWATAQGASKLRRVTSEMNEHTGERSAAERQRVPESIHVGEEAMVCVTSRGW